MPKDRPRRARFAPLRRERYRLLRDAQSRWQGFGVVPDGRPSQLLRLT